MDNPCYINFLQRTVVSLVNVPIRTLSISVEIVSNRCTFDYTLAVNNGFSVNYEKVGGGGLVLCQKSIVQYRKTVEL